MTSTMRWHDLAVIKIEKVIILPDGKRFGKDGRIYKRWSAATTQ